MAVDMYNGFVFKRKGEGEDQEVKARRKGRGSKDAEERCEGRRQAVHFQYTVPGAQKPKNPKNPKKTEKTAQKHLSSAPVATRGLFQFTVLEEKKGQTRDKGEREVVPKTEEKKRKKEGSEEHLMTPARASIFKTRRESLFSYENLHDGTVDPKDFFKHSNASQGRDMRIKQILLWIIRYIGNGRVEIPELGGEDVGREAEALIKSVAEREISVPEVTGSEERENPINERARELIVKTRKEIQEYKEEIEKWKRKRREAINENTFSMPLVSEDECEIVAAPSFKAPRYSVSCTFVSFEESFHYDPSSPLQSSQTLFPLIEKKIEELGTSVNSIRYFVFLASEYTDRIYNSLFEVYCGSGDVGEKDAQALLKVLRTFSVPRIPNL